MLDSVGDGWGSNSNYQIRTSSNALVKQGSLTNGEFQVDKLCLPKGTYKFIVHAVGFSADEIFWVFSILFSSCMN